MTRKLRLFVLVGLAGVLAPVLAVLAQSSSTSSVPASCSPATCTTSKTSDASSADDKIIDEMIAILKETKSEETFIVTAMALGRLGPAAKRALPQLIRNAERLELLSGLFDANADAEDRKVVQHVAEAIVMLAESNKDGQPMGYLSITSQTPYANSPYGVPRGAGGCYEGTVVPSSAAPTPYPVMPGAVTPGTTLAPSGFSTPAAPSPAPSRTVPNASRKDGKPRSSAAPSPFPTR
jgi:hypothetical protein